MAALLNFYGLSADAAAHWDLGTIIDYCAEVRRLKKLSRGEKVVDPEEQYEQIKSILPVIEQQYKEGKVKKEKYDRLLKTIEEYERG